MILSSIILPSILVLGIIGLIAAALLYVAAKKFSVYEDPKIAEIEEMLPGANCGGCGLSGCHAFAQACSKAMTLDNLNCVGVPAETMAEIAKTVGLEASGNARRVAVIKCSNSCEVRDPRNYYDGARCCAVEAAAYQGESDCVYGCLACGDCTTACMFGALTISPGDGLPTVDLDKCTGCGKCVDTCPRHLIELYERHDDRPIVWVACANQDRGAVAMKECEVSCIGCMKCQRTCKHGAVTVQDFLAHIDPQACTGCGECAEVCPRHSIETTAPSLNPEP
ncbi:MAG: RnfABCDGE type electron transport complex subunit B [Muribaculaceae bacterium]|nr:RnfABCDGE type electron transport complex subunit B [Muribaculaceae bacterium]